MAESKKNKNLYDEKSIESLSPLEFTRLKPGVYCGDTTYATQLLVEIIANAIDEFTLGHGSQIDVQIGTDNTVRVRDYGQGFLVNSIREDGKTVLEAAFSVLNTSGKYRSDGTYEGTSLGSFGIGSKLCTYLSHWLIVTSYRDNKYETVNFKEGIFESRKTGVTKEPNGVEVQWCPSEEFFTNAEIELERVIKLFKTLSALCPGLTINFIYKDKPAEKYFSTNGINDLVSEAVNGKEIIKNRFHINYVEGKYKIDCVLTYTSNYTFTLIPYVNTGLTESGPHITAVKSTITKVFNKYFRDKGWLKDKDENLTGDDIQEGMYLAFNITAPDVGYDSQVKSRVTKIDTRALMAAFTDKLMDWLLVNEKEIKNIADKAMRARKAREAARKAKEAVRNPKEKGLKAKLAISDKFIDCVSKKPAERNLLLVEGLSAGSSAIEARNAQTDAIYMLRGKILSTRKQSIDKILANQELSDIIRVIGAGFDKDFDVSKMQFDKIVITSDADSDGANIELLLITFFFTYMRPLVEAGKLYRAVTPLYIVRKGKNEEYLYTEEEMDAWRAKGIKGADVVRAKGLGELNPQDLHSVCFEKQRFKRITVTDAAAADALLEIFEGAAVGPRKQYIYDNAERLGFNFM